MTGWVRVGVGGSEPYISQNKQFAQLIFNLKYISKDTATQHPALNDDTYEDTYSDEKWYSKRYGVCFDRVMPMGVTRKKSKNNFHRVMPPGHNSKKIRNYFSPSYAPRA